MIGTVINVKAMEQVAHILKAIAHPLRLEILRILEHHEPISVKELSEKLEQNAEQSLLSHHLTKMKDKGILQSEKQGKYILYSLKDRQVLKIFDCMENCELI